MSSIRKYRVLFFNTGLTFNGRLYYLRDIFPFLTDKQSDTSPHYIDRRLVHTDFQVRDLTYLPAENAYIGVFGKLRRDAPHKIDGLTSAESELALAPNDRLVEKCHFRYLADRDILIWQQNMDVGGAYRFSEYITDLIQHFCNQEYRVFNIFPILSRDSIQRVLGGTLKSFECKFARPNGPISDHPVWNQNAFNMMKHVDGGTVKVTVSGGRSTLSSAANAIIGSLVEDPSIKSLKVKLDGEEDPIDLFSDRISDSIDVELVGHYPSPDRVHLKLVDAFNSKSQILSEYFKRGNSVHFPS